VARVSPVKNHCYQYLICRLYRKEAFHSQVSDIKLFKIFLFR